jgi:hypothetical protein
MIFPCCIAGIAWAYYNYKAVEKIKVEREGGPLLEVELE